jgi:GrpB-like predicted nucleotidyltransferase (UPF0157 family)
MTNDKHSYSNRKYEVVPYDLKWAQQFEELKTEIQTVFPHAQIEHIGSTAVVGMVGKSCIDILVIVDNLDVVELHINEMESLHFEYAGAFVTKDSRLFRVMDDNVLLANIHFFPTGHPHNKEMLNMRDYLRSHEDEVRAYSELKENLYLKYPNDYASYRKHKDEYMNNLKERVSIESK